MKRMEEMSGAEVVELLKKAAIGIVVQGPGGYVEIEPQELVEFVVDDVAFWCSYFDATRDEYDRWVNQWERRHRCMATTRAGERCKLFVSVSPVYLEFHEWIQFERRGGYCCKHGGLPRP